MGGIQERFIKEGSP